VLQTNPLLDHDNVSDESLLNTYTIMNHESLLKNSSMMTIVLTNIAADGPTDHKNFQDE
jgi:hypothetical protein